MKKTLKWTGVVVGGLIGAMLLVILGLYAAGQMRLNKVYDVPLRAVALPDDPESLAEGKRIFQYRGCEACHGEELEGLVYMDNPALGKVITPNLTAGPGGIGDERTDEDLVHAIQHGIRPDGTSLLFMPSTEFYYLSDADMGKILAYIRSLPPADNATQPSELSFTGFVAMNLVKGITFLPAELIPHGATRPGVPEPGLTAEYGQYLALSCLVCHGIGLSGGEIPAFPAEWPAAPNLTSGSGSRLPSWGESGLIDFIRDGQKHGRVISDAFMPWTSYRHMTDDELRAVYLYLMSVHPEDFGNH